MFLKSFCPSDAMWQIYLGEHGLMEWLVAWQQQTITWTNVYFSTLRFCYIHNFITSWQATTLL